MTLLKNDNNMLPFTAGRNVAVIGKSSNSSADILGNYVRASDAGLALPRLLLPFCSYFLPFSWLWTPLLQVGPICPSGNVDCVPTLYQQIAALNRAPTTLVDDTSKIAEAVAAAKAADYVVLTISNAGQAGEGEDRVTIDLSSDQQALAAAVLQVRPRLAPGWGESRLHLVWGGFLLACDGGPIRIQVGKPTVVVSINGGLISIDTLKNTAPAILVVFAPGVHGGQAVA
jgi:hypothetical protein